MKNCYRLIEVLIRNRRPVVYCFLAIGVYAIFATGNLRVDAIPDIGENQQIVFSDWPGHSPKDIESQITYPLSVALSGISGVRQVRGISAFGFSTIYVIFNDDVDFYWSRSRIIEKIGSSGSALTPEGVVPRLGPDSTGLGQVYWYTVENTPGNKHPKSLEELRSIQDFYVRYRLQKVAGVSEVAGVGGFLREYQINIDPDQMRSLGVRLSQVTRAVKSSNIDVGAEVIHEGDRERIVRGRGFFESLEDIKKVVVSADGRLPILVSDVAEVITGPGFRRGGLDKNGVEAVGGVVTMRFGENPKKVIEGIKKELAEIEAGLPEGVRIAAFYDRTELIENTINTVHTALSEEVVVTILVTLLFLLHFRSSLLIALTLPFGVGISFIFMDFMQIDSNIMSLSGLVIAIGSMVDMGIIMTENIYSKLSQAQCETVEERARTVAIAAAEVTPAILTAVFTTIVTFIPVFGLEGAEGKLFTPLAWSKTLAMLGSVLVAVVFIPCASVFILRGRLRPAEENPINRFLIKRYSTSLRWVLTYRRVFLALPLCIMLAGVIAFTVTDREFMPPLNEGDILYMPVTSEDVSATKAMDMLAYTDRVILAHPLVVSAVGKMGRADSPLDPAPVAMFETVIRLKPAEEWPTGTTIYDIMNELDASLQIPGLINSWDFPIQTRVGMISTGIKTQVGVKIFGDDLDTLQRLSAEIAAVLTEVPGSHGVYNEQVIGKPYLEFAVNRDVSSRYGLNTGDINKVLKVAVGGENVGTFYSGRERYHIKVRYKKDYREDKSNIERILVPTHKGMLVPLGQLGELRAVSGPSAIRSEDGMLRSLVMLNVKERSLQEFIEEARQKIQRAVEIPQGYSVVWAGQYENQRRAESRLVWLVALSLIVNMIIIYFGVGNGFKAAIIFAAVPVALSGGMLLLWISGFKLSVPVWVGFIALFGIAVDDGVVMMRFLRDATESGLCSRSIQDRIVAGAARRVRPLLMTTSTTILALLPVIWANSPGSEVMKPMAIPVIGGMLLASLSLFLVPVLVSLWHEHIVKD